MLVDEYSILFYLANSSFSNLVLLLSFTFCTVITDTLNLFNSLYVPFTATAYKAKYCAHLKFIMDFEKKTCNADISPRLLRHMLKVDQ